MAKGNKKDNQSPSADEDDCEWIWTLLATVNKEATEKIWKTYANIGNIQNKHFDLTLNWKGKTKQTWMWFKERKELKHFQR